MDELVAWAHIPIPEKVFEGVTVENWFPLSGKQGDDAEGAIYLVLSYSVSIKIIFLFFPRKKIQNCREDAIKKLVEKLLILNTEVPQISVVESLRK